MRTDRPTSHLAHIGEISNKHLHEGSSDPLHVWFYGEVFGVSGSNGAISGFANSKGDISAVDRLIYSVFGCRMGFSGSADRMALIPV